MSLHASRPCATEKKISSFSCFRRAFLSVNSKCPCPILPSTKVSFFSYLQVPVVVSFPQCPFRLSIWFYRVRYHLIFQIHNFLVLSTMRRKPFFFDKIANSLRRRVVLRVYIFQQYVSIFFSLMHICHVLLGLIL